MTLRVNDAKGIKNVPWFPRASVARHSPFYRRYSCGTLPRELTFYFVISILVPACETPYAQVTPGKPCSFPTCRAGLHHFSPLPLLRSEHCLHDKQPLSIYAHVRWGGLFAVAWWVTPPQRADLPSGYSPPCCGWRVWASSLAAVTLAPRAVSGRPGVSVVLTPGLLLVSPCTLSYTTAYLFCVPHLLAALFNLPSGASCRNGYTTATFGRGPGMRPMPGPRVWHPALGLHASIMPGSTSLSWVMCQVIE